LTKALATMPDDTVIDGEIVVQVKLHQSTSGRQAGSTQRPSQNVNNGRYSST
jgi:hypothetical protein